MGSEGLDILWILVAGSLVFLMQAGFMALESGFTRSKNSINVATKNMTDFVLAFVVYWVFGYALMFGETYGGWVGTTDWVFPFESRTPFLSAFFFFQVMFCATAATILSGAVAERMRYISYVWAALIISGIVYPVFGHWAWNGADGISDGGWLVHKGFVDFAGSTVVHSVGGWASLATLIIIGPRNGRFPKEGPPQKINGANLPLSVLGALLLYLGWFGFNGGSTLALTERVPHIIANTALAGATGSIAALAIGGIIRKQPDVDLIVNGALAGLVAITANCHCVAAWEAGVIGVVGAIVMLCCDRLLEWLRIDDAVGAIPVHLSAGIWGTLAVALFGDPEILGTGLTMTQQLSVQALGIAAAGVWTFFAVYLSMWVLNKISPLRVTAEEEEMGLNVAEHGASTELIDLLSAMTRQGKAGDLSMRVPVEPFTEVGQIARRYNSVMEMLQGAVNRAESVVRDIQDGIITVSRHGAITSANPGAEKLFGYSLDEILQKPVSTLFAMPGGTAVDLPILIKASRTARGGELRGLRKGGKPFSAEIRLSRTELNGEPLFTGLVKDITERKEAEDALRANRELVRRHNTALAQLAEAHRSMSGDLDGMLPIIARTAADTLEVDRVTLWRFSGSMDQLVLERTYKGSSAPDTGVTDKPLMVSMAEIPTFAAAVYAGPAICVSDTAQDRRTMGLWTDYLKPKQIQSLLAVKLHIGGRLWGVLLFEDCHQTRIWLPEEEVFAGSVANHAALAFEDSSRREAEEAVRQMNMALEERVKQRTGELEHSNIELREAMDTLKLTQKHLVQNEKMAALGELVAGVAHEINTPVGVAVTAASHLEQRTRKFLEAYRAGAMKRSDLDAYVNTTEESSAMLLANLSRAAELVQSFKKVAVDQSSEARRTFNLRAYLDEILLSLRPKLKKTLHEVQITCPDDLEINSFPGLYSQVVTNLIMNSLIHGFGDNTSGGIMTLNFAPDGDRLHFEYTDNGKGISEDHLSRIFDPFFTTRRGSGGSGLGLHLLYNIVTANLGGTVECRSTVGEGTTFSIVLPLERGEETHEQ